MTTTLDPVQTVPAGMTFLDEFAAVQASPVYKKAMASLVAALHDDIVTQRMGGPLKQLHPSVKISPIAIENLPAALQRH